MPLKLGPISRQVDSMARRIVDLLPAHQRFLRQAQALLYSIRPDDLRQKLEWHRKRRTRIPWLVATPRSSLSDAVPAPLPPSSFCVVGADSSSIPPSRHSSLRYYVVNVGYALLTYGSHPDALLEASSRLYFRDKDLYVFPEKRHVPIEGVLLSARMEVDALRIVEQAIGALAEPTLVLCDGPLTLWTLQNESKQVQESILRDFLAAMTLLRKAGRPLGGYISYTNARDVANSLRVWLCHGQPNECSHCQSSDRDLCLALAKIRDRDLFAFLHKGERSGPFSSSSQVLERYGEHRMDFFYLNVGGEVVRVEIPRWVSSDADLLGFAHAAICDQCRRSPTFPPYPPALQEAHEQAVIGVTERQVVEDMVEEALGQLGQHTTHSAKYDSKRRRGV